MKETIQKGHLSQTGKVERMKRQEKRHILVHIFKAAKETIILIY